MVIHKAEKCNINNVPENKIHDDTSGYNNIIIFFIITVITAVVYAITVYPAACSRESVITNKDTETKFKNRTKKQCSHYPQKYFVTFKQQKNYRHFGVSKNT